MILNHFVTASFNNAIYLQVAKTWEEYNRINEFKFLFYEKNNLKCVELKMSEFLNIISIF